MDIPQKYLLDWARKYLRHRDMHAKAILKIEEKDHALFVTEPEVKKLVLCQISLQKYSPSKEYAAVILVTYNTAKNIDALLLAWDFFSQQKDLTLIFLNPFHHDSKWMLKPSIHHKISEPSSLKKGIVALMEDCGVLEESSYAALKLDG